MPKPMSSRTAWALGLGLLSVTFLVGQSLGQAGGSPKAEQPPPPPATLATIDIKAVIDGYDKAKFLNDQFQVEVRARQGELAKMGAKGQQLAKEMENFALGSAEYKDRENQVTKVRVELQAAREQAEREFAQKEADAMAQIYKEIQVMVKAVAEYYHYKYVVKVSNDSISGSDPNSVVAAISRPVVYADPGADITKTVLHNLNLQYARQGGTKPAARTTSPATGPASGGAKPKTGN
jgi:outer membrane protein